MIINKVFMIVKYYGIKISVYRELIDIKMILCDVWKMFNIEGKS